MRTALKQVELTKLPGYLPPEKRRCSCCGKTLAPHIRYSHVECDPETSRGQRERRVPKEIWFYGYDRSGLFCTLRCGYEFGVKWAKARGVR